MLLCAQFRLLSEFSHKQHVRHAQRGDVSLVHGAVFYIHTCMAQHVK